MRPGNQNNKRMRGRGRKGPNPLSRTYESNGPDVKIRGTALHIAEKYQQLARDAQASGDRIMSENYFQHAEHYLRIVAAAQAHLQPSQQPNRSSDAEDAGEENSASAPASGASASGANGSGDRREPRVAASGSEVVGEDSPQPFIDAMPVIDASGQLNSNAAEAGSDESTDDDARPRRRTRGTRGRGSRRDAAESSEQSAAPAEAEAASSDGDEEAPKPKPRRAPRTRRVKPAEESGDTETLAAGE